MIVRATLIIHGRVQGVGFRAAARAIATDMKITGFVENLPDGTVKAVAEAEKDVLEKFIKRIRERELFGKKIVEKVDVKYEDATDEYVDFFIKR